MHDPDARVSAYDYELPPGLIAAHPPAERDAGRLLVVERRSGRLAHRMIRDLPELLRPGDCLVLNDTRVLPARLFGRRTATGGKWEGLFLGLAPDGGWRLIGQTRGRLQPGESITLHPANQPTGADPAAAHGSGSPTARSAASPPAAWDDGDSLETAFTLQLVVCDGDGVWTARPERAADPLDLLNRFGTLPLPHYLERPLATPEDHERYQTTFARHPGAVAAPTAGLHFTPELLDRCRQRGVASTCVTLHVGLGTFRPIAAEHLDDHRMHSEWCALPAEAAAVLNRTRAAGGRIIAVGTTTVRTLESAALARAPVFHPWSGQTDLFIKPPYAFQAVDALLTNFHLPRSTLLVLVSAFAGRDLILQAYRAAVAERYRFYSYGDAMLIA
jgi:S-adenosylmethionine:tRNA ribosyltransferase-isomerase